MNLTIESWEGEMENDRETTAGQSQTQVPGFMVLRCAVVPLL